MFILPFTLSPCFALHPFTSISAGLSRSLIGALRPDYPRGGREARNYLSDMNSMRTDTAGDNSSNGNFRNQAARSTAAHCHNDAEMKLAMLAGSMATSWGS